MRHLCLMRIVAQFSLPFEMPFLQDMANCKDTTSPKANAKYVDWRELRLPNHAVQIYFGIFDVDSLLNFLFLVLFTHFLICQH